MKAEKHEDRKKLLDTLRELVGLEKRLLRSPKSHLQAIAGDKYAQLFNLIRKVYG